MLGSTTHARPTNPGIGLGPPGNISRKMGVGSPISTTAKGCCLTGWGSRRNAIYQTLTGPLPHGRHCGDLPVTAGPPAPVLLSHCLVPRASVQAALPSLISRLCPPSEGPPAGDPSRRSRSLSWRMRAPPQGSGPAGLQAPEGRTLPIWAPPSPPSVSPSNVLARGRCSIHGHTGIGSRTWA